MTSAPALTRPAPATRWLEALPLGNGRIGAMAWGDPGHARFSLNESTLWSGGPASDVPHRTPRREAEDARTRASEGAPADDADAVLVAFDPPPAGHRDWLTVELPGL